MIVGMDTQNGTFRLMGMGQMKEKNEGRRLEMKEERGIDGETVWRLCQERKQCKNVVQRDAVRSQGVQTGTELEEAGMAPPIRHLETVWPRQHLDFDFWLPELEWTHFFVWTTQWVVINYGSPRKLTQLLVSGNGKWMKNWLGKGEGTFTSSSWPQVHSWAVTDEGGPSEDGPDVCVFSSCKWEE